MSLGKCGVISVSATGLPPVARWPRGSNASQRVATAIGGALLWGVVLSTGGCGHAAGNLSLAAVGGTVLAAQSPGQELEQVYYLGAFDPREQVPPTIYRLTVRGQASGISNMKFGSGWVKADLIDSLNTHVKFNDGDSGIGVVNDQAGDQFKTIETGRRLVLFGPEGFREAPKDHRLVILMGANPDAFFEAIDQGVAAINQVQRERADSEVSIKLFQAAAQLRTEKDRLDALSKDLDKNVPTPTADSSASTASGSSSTSASKGGAQ